MNIRKLMRIYYRQKIESLGFFKSGSLPTDEFFGLNLMHRHISWNEVLGWALIGALILHFLLGSRIFHITPFLPTLAVAY